MRFTVLDTRQWITKEVGVRYLHKVGFEIMLWWWHLQWTKQRYEV